MSCSRRCTSHPLSDPMDFLAMQYRQLGRSGLQVSTLTLGTMTFGGTGRFQKVGASLLAGGLLSGKYRRGRQDPEGSRRLAGWKEPPVHDAEKLYDIVDALVAVGEAHGVSAAQVALAWLLGRPGVTSAIIGARNEEQLKDNLKGAHLVLTPEDRAKLDMVSAPVLLYPYWHQAQTASNRLSPADLSLLAPHIKRG